MNPGTEYERFAQEVYQELVSADVVRTTIVKHNVKLKGKSGQEHQIDVYWEYEIADVKHKVAIECKNYKSKVSIKAVRDFYGVLADLNNVTGIMATKIGYQEGAKKFASHHGISLKELRVPNQDEGIIGELEIQIQAKTRRRLFWIDEEWAQTNGFDTRQYRMLLDTIGLSNNKVWEDATHIPLDTTSDNIKNEQGEIITNLNLLEKDLPETPEHPFYAFPFNNAYIDTRCGTMKIHEVRYVYENKRQTTIISLDAREFIKAILKDAINGDIKVVKNHITPEPNRPCPTR